MKFYNMVFSATGRTDNIVKIFGDEWDCEKQYLDLADPNFDGSLYDIRPDDLCLIAVPVFEGRMPKPTLTRLATLKGNGAKTIMMAVYGNRAIDDCLLEMQDLSEKCGFVPVAGIEAVAQHSIFNKFGATRPDESDRAQLKDYAAKIKELLAQDWTGKTPSLTLPGNRPYMQAGGMPLAPKGNKKCISCGLCAEKCPVQAIPAENPASTDKNKCILCMRCVEICPTDARDFPKMMVFAAELAMKKHLSGYKENKLYTARLQ